MKEYRIVYQLKGSTLTMIENMTRHNADEHDALRQLKRRQEQQNIQSAELESREVSEWAPMKVEG